MRLAWKVLIVIFLLFLIGVYWKTGWLQEANLDTRDLEYWEYENGIIKGAQGYELKGSNETCWLMIHGFSASPAEIRPLADGIHAEFNETVIAPLLEGHGRVPSKIRNLTLDNWYQQIDAEYKSIECENVNVVGFSFGAVLVSRLAQDYEFSNLYLNSAFIKARYKIIRLFPLEWYVHAFGDGVTYSKKKTIAQINLKEGRKDHIAYWNMPFYPIKYSANFIDETRENLSFITEPTLIQHSKKDDTADIDSSIIIFNEISSDNKDFITLKKSNHVIFKDYEAEEAIQNIIAFERGTR